MGFCGPIGTGCNPHTRASDVRVGGSFDKPNPQAISLDFFSMGFMSFKGLDSWSLAAVEWEENLGITS